MAHKRKDTLAKVLSWNRHLRPFGKRKQAQRERRAAGQDIRKQADE